MKKIFSQYKKIISPTKEEKNKIWDKIASETFPAKAFRFKPYILGLFLFLIIFSSVLFTLSYKSKNYLTEKDELLDDWQYESSEAADQSAKSYSTQTLEGEASLGYTPGGAADANNFRSNISNGYLPLPTDLTYEGIFSEYYFEKESDTECTQLICPYYSQAASPDPQSGEKVYFLGIGLDSNIKEEDFQRKNLNLVIVLDISGSMSSPFDEYYYDNSDSSDSASKMQTAAESVNALIDHLNPDDKFGMVLFNNSAYTAKPLSRVGDTDLEAIKRHILKIKANGGTNMEAGLNEATALFENSLEKDSEYENRIIFLTDAMPNITDSSTSSIVDTIQANAENKIYMTAIGIGVDFQTELIVQVMNVTGANYYSVHSAEDFKNRMDTNFDYMVSPIIFDLDLKLLSDTFKVEGLYGSPTSDIYDQTVMNVKTLFLSETSGDETKGSMILIQLSKIKAESTNWDIELQLDYKDIDDNLYQKTYTIDKNLDGREFYENTSIRKAILLSRYVNLLRYWMVYEWMENPDYPIIEATDTIISPDLPEGSHYWERQSRPLHVFDHYRTIFESFLSYYSLESDIIGDESLEHEYDLLKFLIEWE